MSDRDDKILEELKGLRTDISGMKTDISSMKMDISTLKEGQTQLETGQKAMQGDISSLKAGQKSLQETEDRRGKLLVGLGDTLSTILAEQQAQRMDIRSIHDELHATKDELKSEILTSRAEAKRDTIDLKAAVVRQLKNHEQRIDELEDAAGIPHPDEN